MWLPNVEHVGIDCNSGPARGDINELSLCSYDGALKDNPQLVDDHSTYDLNGGYQFQVLERLQDPKILDIAYGTVEDRNERLVVALGDFPKSSDTGRASVHAHVHFPRKHVFARL